RNYKLAVLFECKVGPGNLMVCAIDLQSNLDRRTVASQLRRSLITYMAGDHFNPAISMTPQQADQLWPAIHGKVTGRTTTQPGANPGDIIEGPTLPNRER